jgi:hypothetical protein
MVLFPDPVGPMIATRRFFPGVNDISDNVTLSSYEKLTLSKRISGLFGTGFGEGATARCCGPSSVFDFI